MMIFFNIACLIGRFDEIAHSCDHCVNPRDFHTFSLSYPKAAPNPHVFQSASSAKQKSQIAFGANPK